MHQSGHTLYRIKFEEQADDFSYVGKSELVYPLNALWSGVEADHVRHIRLFGRRRTLRLMLQGMMNLADPYGEMTDRDWTGVRDDDAPLIQELLLEVSSTRSRALLTAYGITAACRVDTFSYRNKPLALELAYGFNYYGYDIKGISGWQLNADSTMDTPEKIEFSNIYPDSSVLAYHVAWHTLAVRFIRSMRRTPSLELEYAVELIPLAFAYDEDDHLLRGKRSNAFTAGMGGGCGARLNYAFNPHLELRTDASFRYVRTKGGSTQKWYRDEYYDESYNVTAGTEIRDIDTWIISLTGSLYLSLTFRF